ncbi:MAG: DUF2341 domain-containing protein, partial [Dehalococcoidia bacterium]
YVGRSDGQDIVFTDSENSLLLDYEIEKYDGATGELVAWVRIPSLSSSGDTQIRLWYGNADAGDWSNPAGIWDSNFKMVQHLEETSQGSGSYDDHLDSTGYGNDGEIGSSSDVTMDATGNINGADDFSGSGDSYVEVADSESLDITGSFTLEAWTKLDNLPAMTGILVDKRDDGDTGYFVGVWSDGHIWMGVGQAKHMEEDIGLTTGAWYHVVAIYNSSDDTVEIYIDGTSALSESTTGSLTATTEVLRIGSESFDVNYQVDGIIDEVRVSNTVRNGDWIKTCYNNQSDPAGFHTVGEQQETEIGEKPIPELSTIALFGIGLAVVAGVLVLFRVRRRTENPVQAM